MKRRAPPTFLTNVNTDDLAMLTNLHRIYQDVGGGLQQSFTGLVNPVAAGYVAKLARERVALSRAPPP